ncbi:MAG: type I methionyl aminopeptidase [Chlamydiae bacterium RIFCSPHIGHO2_12_FULL_49_11]|nr:MAG: type I methionyl aminopeptidase [Chlamydiae bacterium RIFCSPHIGHO2_12_FULL_49_11]
MARNDPCWCGSGQKWKKCHWPKANPAPSFDMQRDHYRKQYGIRLKNAGEIEGIRKACQLAAKILDEACAMARAGVTTDEINTLVMRRHKEAGAVPAPLGYGNPPFPKAICTSLNEVICHGIPDDTPLMEGDIVNIDVTSILAGYYGDCSRMVIIGTTTAEKKRVVDTSYACLMQAIEVVKPGAMVCEIGDVIEKIAKEAGCSVVNQFVGHGVGCEFHEPPQIPHHKNTMQIPFETGMTFTIEPMINAGVRDAVIDSKDGWTARTADNRPSAQWEHTLLVTPHGVDILTLL